MQAGDHLGFLGVIEGEVVGFFCQTGDPADLMGYTDEPPSIGGTATFETAVDYRAPISAVIEPDADNDGFGDETQDKCPQSAATQGPCPLIVLDASPLAGKKAVVVQSSSRARADP